MLRRWLLLGLLQRLLNVNVRLRFTQWLRSLLLLLRLWLNVNFGRPWKPFREQGRSSATKWAVRSIIVGGPVSDHLVDERVGSVIQLGILLFMESIRKLGNRRLRLLLLVLRLLGLAQKSKPRMHEAVIAGKQLILVLHSRVIQIAHVLAWLVAVDFQVITKPIRQKGEFLLLCWMTIAHLVRITDRIWMVVTVGSSWNGTILCDKLLRMLVLWRMTML